MIPKRAIDLILFAEGLDQPWKWPGGQSGITIGYGYDLGYESNFGTDWLEHLDPDDLARLATAEGRRGHRARVIAHRFDDIMITDAQAMPVFQQRMLPRYEHETLLAFPGCERLPLLAFGALVSLVFNRGGGMKDDPTRPALATRLEMREIKRVIGTLPDARTSEVLKEIADEIRSMKRIWEGKGLGGLLKRRDAEADLVEAAISGKIAAGTAATTGATTGGTP